MTLITICETCAYPDGEKLRDGKSGGETFAEAVEAAAEARAELRVRRHPCLMNCSQCCSAAIQAEGKVAYVLGRFEPTAEAAEALVGYALGHHASETGVVPYRTWPAGVKGKFVARVPPAPSEEPPREK